MNWKSIVALLILFGGLLAGNSETTPAVKEQLRKIAKIPTINVQFNFGVNEIEGFTSSYDSPTDESPTNPALEIASLRKAMQGGPSDAERYYRLSQLLDTNSQPGQSAQEALAKAIELFRIRAENEPKNGRLLADFGEALSASEKGRAEAEHVLLHAVEAAPNDSHCRIILGRYRLQRAVDELCDKQDAYLFSEETLQSLFSSNRPSASRMESAKKELKDAMDCYDNAVKAAPAEAEAYLNRGVARGVNNAFQMVVKALQGEETNESSLALAFFASDGLEDFRQVAKLDQKNYRALTTIVLIEIIGPLFRSDRPLSSVDDYHDLWESLPDSTQAQVRKDMIALQTLTDDPDKKIALGALRASAMLQALFLCEEEVALKNLRRAFELDPASQSTTEMLICLFAASGNYSDALPVSEKLARDHETPRNLVILAKTHENLGQLEKAEQELRRAEKLFPEDIYTQIGLGMLCLKRDDDKSMTEALTHLRQADFLLSKIPEQERDSQQAAQILLGTGIHYGLRGYKEVARGLFTEVLALDPKNEAAKAALEALGN